MFTRNYTSSLLSTMTYLPTAYLDRPLSDDPSMSKLFLQALLFLHPYVVVLK